MSDATRMKLLKYALIVFGLIYIFSIYPLGIIWPSGWEWHGGEGRYLLQMIMGVYATLGIFLIFAAKNPLEHRSLIWFTVWSGGVHGIIMVIQAIIDTAERGHLIGDAPALLISAIVLAVLMPRRASA